MGRRRNAEPTVALSDPQHDREKLAALLQRQSSSQRKASSQEELEELVTSALSSAGLDRNKLDALKKKNQAELREWAAKSKAERDAQRKDLEPTIQHILGSWRTRLQDLQSFSPPPASPFHYFLVDTASQISSTSKLALSSTNIAPTNNWAEFKFEATGGPAQSVTFTFEWQNPSDVFALINIHGYLVLNGEVEAIAGGGFFPGNTTEAHSYVKLSLSVAGAQQQIFVDQEAWPVVKAVYEGYYSGGQIQAQPELRGFDLEVDLLIVPPGATLTVDLAHDLSFDIDDGQVDYVFTNLGRKVLSPGVLIVVVS